MGKKKKKKPRIIRPKFHVSKSRGGWQWILRSSNMKIYAAGFSLYKSKIGCVRAIEAIQNMASKCEIVVEEYRGRN